ncbi:hypothetical protein CSC70_06670 [Pseudoxanthomonas kalamensis DSM 18571]|uniref:SIMPL domain-containing protein n=1 Tax=Pseudoxanthomonas kalamensis TaxID=289483 RepID=UPI0013916C9D|nr:SIMPL domain-containing protein [Pseudoxanthomonas kalamensis]KAF1710363.1 hypothetical protein CSC70_06670 [Pseudoxanthomonas kalamensis DSM 18571]
MTASIRPLLLALSLVLGTALMNPSQAQTLAGTGVVATDGTLLNVSSQAEASRIPDVATVSAGVVTRAADGNTAMRQNAEQMAGVMDAIKAAGIAEKDIQTSGIQLSPQYRYSENRTPTITGYQATNTVGLKVRDIARLGKVLDALSAQGANQIYGPGFEIDDPEPVYDEARLAALKNAQARAETYAKALGLRVRRIVSISEGGGSFRPVPVRMAAAAPRAKAEMDTPVSPGETTLSVSLDVTFELGK